MKPLTCLLVAAAITASTATAAEICLVPSAANNRNITVACGGTGYGNAQAGFGSAGQASCSVFSGTCEFSPGPMSWTVSRSATDPYDNSGPLDGASSLYLWFACEGVGSGIAAAEFALEATGLQIVAFTPMNGFLNAGTATELLMAVGGCPTFEVLAGRIDVTTAVGAEVVTDSWAEIKVRYR